MKSKMVQGSFIDQLNRLPLGELIHVQTSDDDIGGELLNILSKGLYTNPLDAIREYVQNSIDADATEVRIEVKGDSVYILDRGTGMSREQLLQAREFGVSRKSIEQNVGFRGIGIYSGFDLCDKLVVTSKAAGDRVEHILEIDFRSMRQLLDNARKDPNRPTVPLTRLLTDHTYYRFLDTPNVEASYTLVELQRLSDSHIHRLSDTKEMQNYILRNLPIRFSDSFRYSAGIESALRTNVPGYKSARVILQVENQKPVIVEKPNIPDLDPPRMGFIYSQGKAVAYYWACLVSGNKAITSKQFHKGEFSQFAGLVYKIKGFTIGDRNYLRQYISRIYEWWTGEIYVIDTDVIPTSARDDFEAGPAKDALEWAVQIELRGADNDHSLQKTAVKIQAQRRADSRILEIENELNGYQAKIRSGDFDQFEVYSRLDSALGELKQQRGSASDRTLANKLVEMVQELQRIVKKEIDDPTPVADRKRDAVLASIEAEIEDEDSEKTNDGVVHVHHLSAADIDTLDIHKATEDSAGLVSDLLLASSSIDSQQGDLLVPDTTSEPTPILDKASSVNGDEEEGLIMVIERVGWSITEPETALLTILDETLVDVVGADSHTYQSILRQFEQRLLESLNGEGE